MLLASSLLKKVSGPNRFWAAWAPGSRPAASPQPVCPASSVGPPCCRCPESPGQRRGNGRHARHRRAAGPRSDALRASGRPGREHSSIRQQRSWDPVPGRPGHYRAGFEAGQQRTGAGNRTSGHGHHGRAGGCARKQHRSAAELADHGSLQQGRPVGLRRAGGRGGHEEHPRQHGPEAVELQHHGGHERLHRLGQQRHAGHGGSQLRSEDGGGPALPRHRSTDHAAGGRHQCAQLLGVVSAAALASELASRDASISGLQASKADASALTAYALQSAVDTPSEVSKITAALLQPSTPPSSADKADASALPRWTGWTHHWR